MTYRNPEELKSLMVPVDASIRDAVKKMDLGKNGFISIVDENQKLRGILTDGDFRRFVLDGISLDETIKDHMQTEPFVLNPSADLKSKIRKTFLSGGINHIPIVDKDNVLLDIVFGWDFLFPLAQKNRNLKPKQPVLVMAGGKGTRLDPFSRILPKPLIPIGDKTILEIIIENFREQGSFNTFLTVNHKKAIIKSFIGENKNLSKLTLLEEEDYYGTAGSIKMLEGVVKRSFFVTNCDVIVKTDYAKVLEFHKKGKYVLTLIGSLRHVKIPYGICEMGTNGVLTEIREKPEYDFLVNTGFYVLEPSVFKYIPDKKNFDMTDLIQALQEDGKKVGVYPISQESWLDIGEWQEYKKTLEKMTML